MGFKSISNVAAAALKNPFSSSSSIRSTVSDAGLPTLGSARADHTHHGNAIQSSVSLQDFTLYGKVNLAEDGHAPNLSGIVDENKPLIYHSQRDGLDYTPKGAKGSTVRPKFWCKLVALVATAFLFGFLGYFGFQLWKIHWTDKLQYSIVIDCGSTSTRVQVYAWAYRDSLGADQSPVIIQSTSPALPGRKGGPKKQARAYHRMETEPGLHKLVNNETGVKDALGPLLHWAEKQIPRSHRKTTPLFLLATAGMRGLPSEDAEWLLDNAWAIVDRSPFKCKRSWVKIISGVEEAYYGWVALNYKFGRLGRTPRQPTFGALDLGGSSLQVTFESEEVHLKDFGMNLSVGSTEHHLYAFSHSGFGLNDAFDKSVSILWSSAQESGPDKTARIQELQHPCLHTGFQGQYKCSRCIFQPSSAAVPDAIAKKGIYSELTLVGKPDWEACKNLASDIVNTSSFSVSPRFVDCDEPPCALGKHQPVPRGDFYALSGFFVVYKFFGLQPDAAFAELLHHGKAFCEKPWKKALNSVVPQPLVEHYCFRAPYVVALLKSGLHLKEEQVTVGSGDITWTLGAALLEAGAFTPTQSTHSATHSGIFNRSSGGLLTHDAVILSAFLLAIMVLVLLAVTCCHNCLSVMGRKPHSPLFSQVPLGNPRMTSIFLSPLRLGFGKMENSFRNGDARYKAPHSPAPLGTLQDLSQLRFGSLPTGMGKSTLELTDLPSGPYKGSQLSSRRTQSRDDLSKYST